MMLNKPANRYVTLCLIFMFFLFLPIQLQAQNPEPVNAIAWSSDGTKIALGGGKTGCSTEPIPDYGIHIISALNQQTLTILQGHRCRITSIAWSPNNSMIASSSIDGTSKVWDIVSGQLIATTEFPTLGRDALTWNPDGAMIADVWLQDFRFEIWNPATGESINIVENLGYNAYNDIFDLSWSPDGTKIVSGGSNHSAYTWDITNYQTLITLDGHTDAIVSVGWSPDGMMIATGGADGIINIWDANTGLLINTLQSGIVWDLAWHPSSQYLANVVLDGDIQIWDVSTGQIVETITGSIGRIEDIAWSPDGTQLAYVGSDMGLQGLNLPIVSISLPTCDSTIPASDTTSLIAAINTGNSAGVPYSICLTNSIYNLTARDNSSSQGGANGLPVITGDITIIGNGASIVRDASAQNFRILQVAIGGYLQLDSMTISGGAAGNIGGGGISVSGTLELNNTTITQNRAGTSGGGGIYIDDNAILMANDSTISNNTAFPDGGGIVAEIGTTVTLTNTLIDGNIVANVNGIGAGILFRGNQLTITGGMISNHDARNGAGLLVIESGAVVSLNGGLTISNNIASNRGAGIYIVRGTVTIDDVLFTQNVASGNGGAIENSDRLYMTNSIVENNTGNRGGGIYNQGELTVESSTFSANNATDSGGAIYTTEVPGNYVRYSCISNNLAGNTNGVYSSQATFDATLNWWGAIDGPGGSGTGSGDAVNNNVDYINFITTNCADAISSSP